ncbi:hypothetical protein XINFAN_02868 [Pseudogemmobacter humi]|uniref:Uncharacterized protein n=1 Tax=Pseudogemmobacter humi TaxID=2483812 RepID=A0A3P5XMA1_9RHOB|nr:hypothetical protein XINFAN_02868 [Pseudogemmobacter humi]
MRAIAILSAAAMIVSLFLPWIRPEITGTGLTPWELIRALDPDVQAMRDFVGRSPVELVALFASIALAALFLALVLFNIPSRLIALLAGGLGVGLIGYTAWQIRNGAARLPVRVEVDFSDGGQIADLLTRIPGTGAWIWAGGSLVLLMAGLIGFARR